MPTNKIQDPGYKLSVVCSSPATPTAGGPVRYGSLTGVCLVKEGEGGNASGYATVDFGPGVWDLSVTDTGGGIAVGDTIFFADGAPPTLSDDSSGYFFGFALETVAAGQTGTIKVLHVPSPGSGTLGAGTVGTANLANLAVTGAKMANTTVTATQLAADAVTTAKILNANVSEAKIEAGAAGAGLTGLVTKFVADANVIGGIPVLHRIDVAAGATADVDVTLTHKTRVLDAWLVKRNGAGGGAGTITVKNGANAITDDISININDKVVARAGTIDDAQHEIAAGGTLRIARVRTASTDETCTVYVLGVRVA